MDTHFQRLIAGESLSRKMLDNIPTAIICATLDRNAETIFLNKQFYWTFGYILDDIPTMEQWMRRAYPDEEYRRSIAEQWIEDVENASRDQGTAPPREYRVTCKDGAIRNVLISAVILDEMLLVSLADITDLAVTQTRMVEFLARMEQSETKFTDVRSGTRPAIALPPLRVLAVDDIPENLELHRYYLEGQPVLLVEVSSGMEALERFRETSFDCVLLDMQMPGLSGAETVRAMRAVETGVGRARTPVIAISAGAFAADSDGAMAAGCDAYLARPLRKEELLIAIRDHLVVPREEAVALDRDLRPCATLTPNGPAIANPSDPALFPLIPRVMARIGSCADELEVAGREGRFQDASRSGHTIKGLGEQFGLPDAVRTGREIEAAAAVEDSVRLAALSKRVRELL